MITGRRATILAAVAGVALLATACSSGAETAGTGTTQTASSAGSSSETTSTTTSTETGTSSTETGTSEAPPVQLEGQVNEHGASTVSGGSIELELDDFYFQPTYVQATPGATVEVELSNEGSASHTFTIDDQNIDVTLEPDGHETVQVTMPDSGSLRFYCRFHASQGMQGAFTTTVG